MSYNFQVYSTKSKFGNHKKCIVFDASNKKFIVSDGIIESCELFSYFLAKNYDKIKDEMQPYPKIIDGHPVYKYTPSMFIGNEPAEYFYFRQSLLESVYFKVLDKIQSRNPGFPISLSIDHLL